MTPLVTPFTVTKLNGFFVVCLDLVVVVIADEEGKKNKIEEEEETK